jgi:hypothetical protein
VLTVCGCVVLTVCGCVVLTVLVTVRKLQEC